MAVVHTYYYTDPVDPWSWALEPALRKLTSELEDSLGIEYVMCGMAREVGDARGLVVEMLEASSGSGMPVDARLWLVAPPRSSHPACLAVKAAAEQGGVGGVSDQYLRRLREGLMCRGRKLDTADALLEEARLVPGLDVDRLRVALSSHAILEAFAGDLERCGAVPPEHRSRETLRPRLPSLEFQGADGEIHGVYGPSDYEALRAAAVAAGASFSSSGPPSIEDALRRFGSMATAEVAAVCDLPGPRTPAELWRLALEWRVRAERLGSGEVWSLT